MGMVVEPLSASNGGSVTMSEHGLLQIAELARHQLTALRARLDNEKTALGSSEIRSALGDLVAMLEELQAHYALLYEILARTSDAVFAKDTDGCDLMINLAGAAMFGKSVADILGRDDTALFALESAQRMMAIDRTVMATGRLHTFEETFDIRGVPITLLTTETAWYEPRGSCAVSSVPLRTSRIGGRWSAAQRHNKTAFGLWLRKS